MACQHCVEDCLWTQHIGVMLASPFCLPFSCAETRRAVWVPPLHCPEITFVLILTFDKTHGELAGSFLVPVQAVGQTALSPWPPILNPCFCPEQILLRWLHDAQKTAVVKRQDGGFQVGRAAGVSAPLRGSCSV